MTDAAVVADSAPAPVAPPPGAPINEIAPTHNHPLGSQIPPDAVAKANEPAAKSLDDSIDRAMAKSAEKQAKAAEPAKDVKPEPVKDAKLDQPRDNGKFAPREPAKPVAADSARPADAPKPAEAVKPSHTAEDAPSRFTETAKAKWHTADPEIRGEVLRMQRELTDGYQKYKTAAERDSSLAEFHEMATKSGTDVKTALSRYTAMESKLRSDPLGGLEEICANIGVSLKDVAAHVMGQTPDQNASKQDATIRELKQEIAGLKEQVGGVTQTFKQQQEHGVIQQLQAFASQPEHARYAELENDIAMFLETGRAKNLSEAYEMAERLNPAPAQAKEDPPAASSAAIDPPVHPDKGQKSINGAPSSGLTSPPAGKRVVRSLEDSLERAFGRAG